MLTLKSGASVHGIENLNDYYDVRLKEVRLARRKGHSRFSFALADVVRTRMFITDISSSAAVLAVHGEVFGVIRPTATMVEVSGLIEPSVLIEIEAEARRG